MNPTPSSIELPFHDELGFCNVLMSAIGGDGANMAAKLLFKACVSELDLDGAYDARYGSEKKGTPTDVSLRLCRLGTPVHESGPTNRPHILCVFREALIQPLALNRGLQKDAVVIVNTSKSPEDIRAELELNSGTIYCLDATTIAVETGSRLNVPILALLGKILKIPIATLREAVGKTWPRAREANLKAFDRALEGCTQKRFEADGKFELVPPIEPRGKLGYMNMNDGGAIDSVTHISLSSNTPSASITPIPEFRVEICTHCGLCLLVCSDPGSLVWDDKKMIAIDPVFCKGCMRCVEVCPETKKGKALTEPLGATSTPTSSEAEAVLVKRV
ncbi:MAG: 2-oxoacid:acceptor oxidoreductase family protein [Acidobacteriia bacterium]|nr:2-oxoacid:acceptor oxidoreductase family protein [Terriglobia bacterium]